MFNSNMANSTSCHPAATSHTAGFCHRANSTACHPRATYHIAGCCPLVNPLRSFVPYRGTYGKFRFSPMSHETGHTIMLSSCGLESPWVGHYVAVVVYGNFRASTTGFTVSLFTFVCLLFGLLCDRLWHQLVNVIKLLK